MLKNVAFYLVEFLKLLVFTQLIGVKLCRIRWLPVALAGSAAAIFIASLWCDPSSYSICFGLLSLFLLFFFLEKKSAIGLMVFAYICIGLSDLFLGSAAMLLLDLRTTDLEQNDALMLFLNAITLFLLLIAYAVRRHTRNIEEIDFSPKQTLPFIFGGLSLAFYTASLQITCTGDDGISIQDIAVLSLNIGGLLFIFICFKLLLKSKENERLRQDNLMISKTLEMSHEYYTAQLNKEKEIRRFQHDIKNHLYCMNILLRQKEYDQLEAYLAEITDSLEHIGNACATGNNIVNMIVSEITAKYPDVTLTWEGTIPEDVRISAMDLCTVFSNLLTNAFEHNIPDGERSVTVQVRHLETNLLVMFSNPFAVEPRRHNGVFLSSKPEKWHGYGLKNVSRCMEEMGGFLDITTDDGFFRAVVLFPGALSDNLSPEKTDRSS